MCKLKKLLMCGASSFLLIFFSGCGGGGNEGVNSVGSNLVSGEVVDDINATTMLSVVKAYIDANATNAFGYKAVKIIYDTTNENGESVKASGLLVIPEAADAYISYLKSIGKDFSISLMCDNHGTIFTNSEAPSVQELPDGMPENMLAIMATSYAGFAIAMPDYLGYGASKGENHPFILKKSTQASLDMIRASVRYLTDNGYIFNGQLYISGYSEGGYIAMALAEDIQENHSGEFSLMGVTPMEGPYDVEAIGKYDLNASKKMEFPAFLAYIANSYSKEYSSDINLTNIVVKPDVFANVDLFGGDYSEVEIHVYLGLADPTNGDYGFGTHYTNELFKDSFINDYQSNINNPVRVRFAENSVYDWTPEMKMNIIHCLDDEIIPYNISAQKAYDAFVANGATGITLTPIPSTMIPAASSDKPFVHQRCAGTAYEAAISWFSQIRSGDIK